MIRQFQNFLNLFDVFQRNLHSDYKRYAQIAIF
jgi:hypothetical protein